MKALVDISRNNWLQKIPTKWEIFRIKNLFQLSHEKNQGGDLPVLSLAQSGIRTRDISTNEGQLAESYENYTRIRPDDLVFNPMDLRSGAIDLSTYDGVISLAYSVLRKRSGVNIHLKYFKYYFQWHYLDEIFFPFGQGVSADHRWTLKDNILLNFPVLFPPLEAQKQIADFLDEKTKVINELIAKKGKLIELLCEKRAALITRAVTKGFDPSAKLKSSGIDWLGDIPVGWEICRIRFLVQTNPPKSEISDFPNQPVSFLPMSYVSENGALDLSEQRDLNFIYTGYTYFRDGDVILAKITPCFENGKGAFISGLKNGVGFGSTEFHVFRPKKIDGKFLYYFFASEGFMKFGELNMRGTAGQKRVPDLFIKDFVMGVPKAKEQKQIADFLDAETGRIDKAATLIESQIEKLKEYRSSLIYHAVTGKIKI